MSDRAKLVLTVLAIILGGLASLALGSLAAAMLLSPPMAFVASFAYGIIIGSVATLLIINVIEKRQLY